LAKFFEIQRVVAADRVSLPDGVTRVQHCSSGRGRLKETGNVTAPEMMCAEWSRSAAAARS
jgi:hypothetical protein